MAERSNRSADGKKKEEFEKLIMKPLPFILADMQEAIRITTESARGAEETAKIAKESSEASRKASEYRYRCLVYWRSIGKRQFAQPQTL